MPLFWAVDATQADTLRVGVVQDFDGVAVEDGNDGAGVICRKRATGEKDAKECGHDNNHRPLC